MELDEPTTFLIDPRDEPEWNFNLDELVIDYGTGTVVATERNGTFYVNGVPVLALKEINLNPIPKIMKFKVLDKYFPFYNTSKYFYARYFLNRGIKGQAISATGKIFKIEEYDKILRINTDYILEFNSMVIAELIRKWFPKWTFSATGNAELPRKLQEVMIMAINARKMHRIEDFMPSESVSSEIASLIVKHQTIVYESDANKPRLIDIINRFHVGTVEVKQSNIQNAGNGLFALKQFKRGDLICDYGGLLTSNNANDYLEDDDKTMGAYAVEIAHSDDPRFKGWYVDARRFFTINEPGRWANMRRNGTNNAEIATSIDFRGLPKLQLFATARISYGEEIYLDYGSEYYWGEQAEGIVRRGNDVYADRDYKKGEIVGIYAKKMKPGKAQPLKEYYQTLEYIYQAKKGYFYPIDEPENTGRWIGIAAIENESNVGKRLNNVVEVYARKDIRKDDKLLFKSDLSYVDKDNLPLRLQSVERDEFLVQPYRRRD